MAWSIFKYFWIGASFNKIARLDTSESDVSVKELKEVDLFKVLSHPMRARIVELLNEKVELSYTELLNTLGSDTGQLNFHLKTIGDLCETTPEGTYILTKKGRVAHTILREVRQLGGSVEEARPEAHAPLTKRAVANVVDFVLLVGLPSLIVFGIATLTPEMVGPFIFDKTIHPIMIVEYFHAVLSLALVALTLMETHNGQTLGKYIVGIRVVKRSGRRLNLVETTIRNVAKIFFIPLDLLVGMLFYREKGYLRFADYYVDAKVVEVKEEVT